MEFLSQYDYKFNYVEGILNTAADALSRIPENPAPARDDCMMIVATFLSETATPSHNTSPPHVVESMNVASVLKLSCEDELLRDIRKGYETDPFITKVRQSILEGSTSNLRFHEKNGLLFTNDRIIVPNYQSLRERLFFLAHDQLGHFGFDTAYANLRKTFYWPNMHTDLEKVYIPGCKECQRNKSLTS